MKRYTPWLLVIPFLANSIMATSAHLDYKEAVAPMKKFDPELFDKTLSNIGPLCVFAKKLLSINLVTCSDREIKNRFILLNRETKSSLTQQVGLAFSLLDLF